jgi:hypothetical protein
MGQVFLHYLHWLPDPAQPGRMMKRLPVTSVAFSDSTEAPQLRIADWAAGAVRQWATSSVTTEPDPFTERLEPLAKRWTAGGIWPDPDFRTTGGKPIGRPEEPDAPAQ